MIKKCIICNEEFNALRIDRTICYSEKCKYERNKIARTKRKSLKKAKREKRCIICKILYVPVHKLQKTCGCEDCIRANKNLSRKKEEHEFDCQICGVHTWSAFPNAKLCGKKSCRQEYTNGFNRLVKYKDKIREKINKKATVFGEWASEEVKFVIRSKLEGKTYPFIATKLKRKLTSVEKKMPDIFNTDKYLAEIEEVKLEIEMLKPSKKTRNLEKWNQEIKNYFYKN